MLPASIRSGTWRPLPPCGPLESGVSCTLDVICLERDIYERPRDQGRRENRLVGGAMPGGRLSVRRTADGRHRDLISSTRPRLSFRGDHLAGGAGELPGPLRDDGLLLGHGKDRRQSGISLPGRRRASDPEHRGQVHRPGHLPLERRKPPERARLLEGRESVDREGPRLRPGCHLPGLSVRDDQHATSTA